ncbi:ubiquitin carboxyl-terminal hydrolase 4/11/15 [Sporothrix brasiliensis 5110]|uniref:ubiquitinyl hydrolase 1 n=1 Tax=Sporothrix brasiliensis 5110 TaxID=1398154 RepID=A0A0C2F1Y4_9PEZI|nr:ubiquitin carboxyl-terminal hydrolase 4/11/15 [Sporothrix brasiliensis 5110]KIH92949.1 ubiquitin carboxyl-terminal hydrolase 4/11/15 [Sporothrix brasiliensis 5110]
MVKTLLTRQQHRRPGDLHNGSRDQQLQAILPSTEREDVDPDKREGKDRTHHTGDDSSDEHDSDNEDENDDGNSSDLNPTFSFSAASNAASSGPTTPTYSRAGSVSLPPTRTAALGYVNDDHDDSETTTPDAEADDFDAASNTSSPPSPPSVATGNNTAASATLLTKNSAANIHKTRSSRPATRRVAATSALPTDADTIGHRRKIQKHKTNASSASPLHLSLPSIHSRRPAQQQRSYERSQSPLVPISHRAIIMSGASDETFHRSSSPLKRTASNMEESFDNIESASEFQANSSPPQPSSSSPLRTNTKEDDVEMATAAPSNEADAADTEAAQVEADVPPIEEQIRTIENLVKDFNTGELEEGTAAYLVSRRWLARAQALGSGDAAKAAKEVPQGSLGPVDNSDIAGGVVDDIDGGKTVRLKAGTSQEDFEYFSKEAWDLLVSWHGLAKGQLPIIRVAHNTAPNSMIPNVQYELHPPVFTLHRLWSAVSTISHTKEVPDAAQAAPVIMCTSNYNIQGFLRKAKTLLHIPMERHVRMWSVPRKLAASNTPSTPAPTAATTGLGPSLSTPPDSPRLTGKGGDASAVSNPQDSWSKLLLEVTDFMMLQPNVEREQLSQVKDLTHDKKYNGRQTLAFISITVDQTIVLDENVERNLWVSTYNPKTGGKDKGKANTASSTLPAVGNLANTSASRTGGANSTAASSGRSSPSHVGPVTRGRTKQKSGRTMGCVGLGNLGNTCYMNAALQCLRSVEELTKYFLVHENEAETNHSNPLGHGGNVANAYAFLLEEIFRDNVPMSIAPRQFKSTIGRYAPAFAGYGQQDSQEFLGFLLDGLQEDLSRVKKKPYIEKPDSTDEMINNPVAIREMAEKVWDITKRRDDSIIADLFTGMYKSTLICPVCQKVSITFDPFTNLTLPLPIQNVWSKTIRFIPLNDRPVYLNIELDKTSSVRSFKEFISVRVGVPADRLVAAEELRDNIIRVYDDFECVSEEMAANDSVLVYEVERTPTNNSGSKMPRKKPRSMLLIDDIEPEVPSWDSPMAKSLLVPIIHRFDPNHRRRYTKSSGLACPPHFIVVTPEEARNEDVIRRKILEKVASYSTWAEFSKAENPAHSPSTATSTTTTPDGSSDGSRGDDATDATDNDIVVTSGSDVESASDSKVIAKSIEGEDDMIDITMKDASAVEAVTADQEEPGSASSKILYKFNRHRPRWVTEPSLFLAGELQNLFQMGYYDDTSNLIPIKWSGSSDEKLYPSLRSRIPAAAKRSSVDRDMDSPGPWESAAGTDNEESSQGGDASPNDEDSARSAELTRMAEESDDEDSAVPPPIGMRSHPVDLPKSGPARRRALKQYKARGPKGAKRRQRHPQASANRPPRLESVEGELESDRAKNDDHDKDNVAMLPVSSSTSNGSAVVVSSNSAPLIRLGEGIMVDWSAEGWDAVFGKEGPDDKMRGEPTYEDPIPVVDDPELQEKKRNRISRKKRGLTLDECLDEFEREEILSENDMWYCPRCKEHRRASKKFDLWKTPDILVVHLKRFSSSGWRRDKLDMRVDFPVEGLDITKRVLDRQTGKEEIYDLIGVDDHWGGLGGGHYTAFAKNFIDHQWYEYNDSSVSRVNDSSRVVSAAAYLLFYRRRSNVPLGGPRFIKIDEKFAQEMATSDDDASESGEGRRLGTGSSLIGSSSASKGAAADRRHRASPGLASSGTSSLTLDANGGGVRLSSPTTVDDYDDDADSDYLPPFSSASRGKARGAASGLRVKAVAVDSGDEQDDAYGAASSGTGLLNFGESSNRSRGRFDDDIRKSVEMDDLYPGSSHHESGSWTQQSWSFGPSVGGGNHNSPGSDGADVDELELGDTATATGSDARDADLMSLGTADHQDVDMSFLSTAVPVTGLDALRQDDPDSPTPPPPDILTQANMEDIQQQVWARKLDAQSAGDRIHTITMSDNGADAASENAVDIHISEDEEGKMDE